MTNPSKTSACCLELLEPDFFVRCKSFMPLGSYSFVLPPFSVAQTSVCPREADSTCRDRLLTGGAAAALLFCGVGSFARGGGATATGALVVAAA